MIINNEYTSIRKVKLKDNVNLNLFEIKEIDENLQQVLDSKIVNITNGPRKRNINIVKNKLHKFLKSKENSTTEMGAIAEFFIHIYLSVNDYKQECLFFNLEENSIKKGFDGYYSKNNEEWIMESKSGSINTKGISHTKKVKEAYEDLDKRFKGIKKPSETINNPWDNAYNHMKIVDTEQDILDRVSQIADDFELEKFRDVKDFNIIPCGTIFFNNTWEETNIDNLQKNIESLIPSFNYKKLEIICLTKKSIHLFIKYLEETLNDK